MLVIGALFRDNGLLILNDMNERDYVAISMAGVSFELLFLTEA